MVEQDTKIATGSLAAASIIAANLVGIGIGYAITVVLARQLSRYEFAQYVGTIATLGLLVSLAEAGFGKYALRILPIYIVNRSYALLRGYLCFAFAGCICLSLLLGVFAIAIEVPLQSGLAEKAILLAIVFFPAMTAFGVAVDILLSLQMVAAATIISRILVPLTTLGLIGWGLQSSTIDAFAAVICFCTGSLCGACLGVVLCANRVRRQANAWPLEFEVKDWAWNGFSFLAAGFLIAWVFKAPLVLIHHFPHDANQLAMLAPALETGCLVLLLSKSTDKLFQPTMSVIIESNDWARVAELHRSRLAVVGTGIGLFLVCVSWFGKRILGLYGDDFVNAYPALCLIALGSSCWTMFSLAPVFLMFANQRNILLVNLTLHGIVLAILTALLFSNFGVTGAAVAYALTISSLAVTNLGLALRCLRKMRLGLGAT